MKHKLILLLASLFPISLFLTVFNSNAGAQEDRSALIRRLQPSIVWIGGSVWNSRSRRFFTDYKLGSGFFVDEQKRVITCYNVVEGVEDLTVTTFAGHRFRARLLRKQIDSNLALIELVNTGKQVVEPILIIPTAQENGAELIAFDESREFSVSRDYSGRPIISSNGMVVGLSVPEAGSARKGAFAIPGKRLLSFLAFYYETVARNSTGLISHFNLGRVYDEMNRNRDAEMEYRKALRFNPNSAQALRALGVLYLKRAENPEEFQRSSKRHEDARKAIEFLERAVDLDPSNGKGHYNLAAAYFKANEHEKAREQCDTMLSMKRKRKLSQPVLGNAERLCAWPKVPYRRH